MESEMEAEAEPLKQSDVLPKKVQEVLGKAQFGWLKNTEVCDVLFNYKSYNLKVCTVPPVRPPGGSIFLFDRKSVRFFRKDGHNWRKKADGKTVRETHEKLKVGNEEILNCYYAHADQEDNLQRRCYWLLDRDDNIVLVHYLNVSQNAQRNVAQSSKPVRESTRKHLTRVKVEHPSDDMDDDHSEPKVEPQPEEPVPPVLDKKNDIQPSPGVLYVSRPVLEQQTQATAPSAVEGPSKHGDGTLPHSYSFDSLLTALDDKGPEAGGNSKLFHQNSASVGMLDSFFQGWEPMEQTPSLDPGPTWQADDKDLLEENGSPTSGFFEQAGITFFGAASSLVGSYSQQSAAMSPMVEAPSHTLSFDLLENQDSLNLPDAADNKPQLPNATTYCQPLTVTSSNHVNVSTMYFNDQQPVSAPGSQPYYGENFPLQLTNNFGSAPAYGPYLQQEQTFHPAPPPPPPPLPPVQYHHPQQHEHHYHHVQQQQQEQFCRTQQYAQQPQDQFQPHGHRRQPQQQDQYSNQQDRHYSSTQQAQYRPAQGPYPTMPQSFSQPLSHYHMSSYYMGKGNSQRMPDPAAPVTNEEPSRAEAAVGPSADPSASDRQGKAATRKKAHSVRKTQTRERAQNKRDGNKTRTAGSSLDKSKNKTSAVQAAAMDAETVQDPFLQASSSHGRFDTIGQNGPENNPQAPSVTKEYTERWGVTTGKEGTGDSDEDERGGKARRGVYQSDRALHLHRQLHDLDKTVRTELTVSSSASVADQVKAWEARLQQLENETKAEKPGRLKSEPIDNAVGTSAVGPPGIEDDAQPINAAGGVRTEDVRMAEDQHFVFDISEFTPEWDFTSGGAKMIVTITCGSETLLAERMGPLFVMFDHEQVPVTILCPGVLRCFVPSHQAGLVDLCVTFGDGKARSKKHGFEYRPMGTTNTLLLPRSATDMTDRELQMRMINILLGSRAPSSTALHMGRASSGMGEQNVSNALALIEAPSQQGFCGDVEAMSADSREQLLMLLLEHEIHKFTAEVMEHKRRQGKDLQSSATANKMNELGLTGLALIHITAALGYNWAVQMLLRSGAEIDLRDSWGFSALHWAAGRGREDTVALLLARGAKPNMLTPESSIPPAVSPADLAAMKGHQGIAAYIGETMLIRSLSQMKLNKQQQQPGGFGKNAAQRKRSRHVRNESSEALATSNPFTTAPQLQSVAPSAGASTSGLSPSSPEQEDEAMVVAQRAKEAAAIIEAAYLNHLQRKASRQERRLKLKKRETEAVAHMEESKKAWEAVRNSSGQVVQLLPEQEKARVLDLGQRIVQKYAELRVMLHTNGSDSELPDTEDHMEEGSDTPAEAMQAVAQHKLVLHEKPRRLLRPRRLSGGVKGKESVPERSTQTAGGELLKEQYRKTLAAAVVHVESIVSCEGARAQYMRLKQACSSLTDAYTAAQQLAQAADPVPGMLSMLETARPEYSVLV